MKVRNWIKFKACTMLVVAMLGLIQETVVHAQALPAATFAMNRAVGTIITRAAAARGFAANDPRIATTLTSVSSQLTSVNTAATVAGVGLAIAGAPMWLGIVANLGVLAVGAALIAGTSSIFIDQGKLTVQQPLPQGTSFAAVPNSASDGWSKAAAEGLPVYRLNGCMSNDAWCTKFPALPSTITANFTENDSGGRVVFIGRTIGELDRFHNLSLTMNRPDLGEVGSVSHYWLPNANGNDLTLTRRVTGQERVCNSEACVLTPFQRDSASSAAVGPGVKPAVGNSLETVLPKISQDSLNQPLSADTLSNIADKAWRNAASQPGYQGLPYSMTQPITATEVQPWLQADPALIPKVSDLLSPANNPGDTLVPISPAVQPSTNTSGNTNPSLGTNPNVNVVNTPNVNIVNTPNVNVLNKVQIDPGTFPTVAEPNPTAPTAWSIIYPFRFISDKAKTAISLPAGECPRPTFQVFGKDLTISSHCTLTESNRAAFSSIMMVVYSVSALTILLSA